MSKDEIIAMQAEQIARLTSQIEMLTSGLMGIVRDQEASRPLTSTERSRLARERKRADAQCNEMQRPALQCNENATENVAPEHENATKCNENATFSRCIGVAPPRERVDPTFPPGDVDPGSRIPEEVSNSLSGHATPVQRKNVASVAFDRERAEADAAKHGLVGADFEAELQRFTDYWDSAGWKRKGGPVKDRNATWRSWLDSPFRQNGNGNTHGKRNVPDYSGIDSFVAKLEAMGVE